MSVLTSTQILSEIQGALAALEREEDLLSRVERVNPWFTPGMVRHALQAHRQLVDPTHGAEIVARYAHPLRDIRVGIIMAGNVPLVGLHDLVAVLLMGHHAVVKCSSRDPLLLPALLSHCSAEVQSRVTLVDRMEPVGIGFLIATGSDNTALHIGFEFEGTPKVVRHNRFSIAVAMEEKLEEEWSALANDILLYHGMGCRSVSSILVPKGFNPSSIVRALEGFDRNLLSADWWRVVEWERAEAKMRGEPLVPCRTMVVIPQQSIRPAKVGCLHIVEAESAAMAMAMIDEASSKLQCVVGRELPFGGAQCPGIADFPDGVDVLAELSAMR